MIRLLIIEDSSLMTSLIEDIANTAHDITVVGTARNGSDGVAKVRELKPNCITMDVNMPGMNGVEAVRQIMAEQPTPILMVSAYTASASDYTLQALEAGAIDFIQKPDGEISTDLDAIADRLIAKLRIVAAARPVRPSRHQSAVMQRPPAATTGATDTARLVVGIGVSTGGPRILKEIIPLFGKTLNAAVVISQHMPPQFTSRLATLLDSASYLNIAEAENDMPLHDSHIYICPGDKNLTVSNNRIVLQAPTAAAIHTPSIDVMFASLAENFGARCAGVIMTGMGNDGTRGALAIKKHGGYVIAQDEDSCIVYGMPKAVAATGTVDEIVSARIIPRSIQKWITRHQAARAWPDTTGTK